VAAHPARLKGPEGGRLPCIAKALARDQRTGTGLD